MSMYLKIEKQDVIDGLQTVIDDYLSDDLGDADLVDIVLEAILIIQESCDQEI